MLYVNTKRTVDQDPADGGSFFSEIAGIVELVTGTFRQQFRIILPISILVTVLGTIYTIVTPPTYTARATMIIDRGKVEVQLGGILTEVPVEIDSQIQLIKSETVGRAVVNKLNLADDPEFTRPPAGWRQWVPLPRRNAPEKIEPARAALDRMLERLKVMRTGYVVEIEFSMRQPQRAADIANAFADSYVESQQQAKQRAAQEAGAWLKDQIQELRDQSIRADEAVVQFKAKNNIVAADGKLINDQEISLLNAQLIATREKTAEARARLNRIESIIKSDSPDSQAIATVTDTLNNPIIVKLRTQYLDLVNREATWSRDYGADHLAVVSLRRQIREIRGSLNDELRRIGETYRSEYEIARQRQADLEKAIKDAVVHSRETNQALTTLRDLESSAETYRGLYRSALQRGTELIQKQSFPGAEARLITRAAAPTKGSPDAFLVLCASAISGMLLGFGIGALRASLDRVFRTPPQVEALLQARCLALVPAVKPEQPARSDGKLKQDGSRVIKRDANVIWNAVDHPLARFAEAMRSIRSEVRLNKPEKSCPVLGFTSSLPGEGKSTIAAAFGLLVAQSGVRTILVDCDLRNPALSAILAPRAKDGVVEVISGKKQLNEVLWTGPGTGLAFLPAVMERSRAAESSTILASGSLRELFEKLRHDYDCVIADLSPAAPIVDVRSTAGLVDAYVFVVEWGRTKVDIVDFALRKAPVVQENLLGVVLNKVDFRRLRQYEGYRRDYYADKHYAPYGQV